MGPQGISPGTGCDNATGLADAFSTVAAGKRSDEGLEDFSLEEEEQDQRAIGAGIAEPAIHHNCFFQGHIPTTSGYYDPLALVLDISGAAELVPCCCTNYRVINDSIAVICCNCMVPTDSRYRLKRDATNGMRLTGVFGGNSPVAEAVAEAAAEGIYNSALNSSTRSLDQGEMSLEEWFAALSEKSVEADLGDISVSEKLWRELNSVGSGPSDNFCEVPEGFNVLPMAKPESSIPKRLLLTSSANSLSDLSETLKQVQAQNQKLNPGFEVIYHNDEQMDSFIKENFPSFVYQAFSNLKAGAYKADLWRLCALYHYGGVYADINTQLEVSISQVINFEKDLLVLTGDRSQQGLQVVSLPNIGFTTIIPPVAALPGIQSSFMAAARGHRFLKFAIEQLSLSVLRNDYGASPLDVTGPAALYRLFTRFYKVQCSQDNTLASFAKKVPASVKLDLAQVNDWSIMSLSDNTLIAEEVLVNTGDYDFRAYQTMWRNRDVFTNKCRSPPSPYIELANGASLAAWCKKE